jgi:hypothetical protein
VTRAWRRGGDRVKRTIRRRLPAIREGTGRGAVASQPTVYSVAFGPQGEGLLKWLCSGLRAEGVGYMLGATPRRTARRIHVSEGDLPNLLEIAMTADAHTIVRRRNWRHDLDASAVQRLLAEPSSFDLLAAEDIPHGTGMDGEPLIPASRIEVAVWKSEHRPGGQTHYKSDRAHTIVSRLSEAAFTRLRAEHHDFGDEDSASTPTFDIDVVYTWVDGDDPAWQATKAQYARDVSEPAPKQRTIGDERFRNRDELKYSLRSIEQFAPWVRHIYIVTAGQRPAWLDADHPKITLVDHREIYRDAAWLPTFNSSGIETQLHHIPGLADHFLYFNDDFFLGQLADPIDFFHGNGVLKYFTATRMVYEPDIDADADEYIQADANALRLIIRDFETSGRNLMQHVPYPSSRPLQEEMEQRYQSEFDACAATRFRSAQDLRPIAFMQYHYGYHSGQAIPDRITHRYLTLWKPHIEQQLDNVARADTRRSASTTSPCNPSGPSRSTGPSASSSNATSRSRRRSNGRDPHAPT